MESNLLGNVQADQLLISFKTKVLALMAAVLLIIAGLVWTENLSNKAEIKNDLIEQIPLPEEERLSKISDELGDFRELNRFFDIFDQINQMPVK